MTTPCPMVAGNWKMNGLSSNLKEIVDMGAGLATGVPGNVEVMIAPPFTLLSTAREVLATGGIAMGAQDCHRAASGAHTGDISAEMLKDVGCSYVIVGHSERRADHRERDADIRAKAEAAWRAGLTAIICVGETELERDGGKTIEVVLGQLRGSIPKGATSSNTVIAYEPVWAIGTGRTPTTEDVEDVHAGIRDFLSVTLGDDGKAIRILYGGSVKPSNARELMAVENVNGALVGGASLKAEDFLGIIAAYGQD